MPPIPPASPGAVLRFFAYTAVAAALVMAFVALTSAVLSSIPSQ